MFRHVTEVTLGSFAFPLWGGVLAADRRAPPVELRARAEAHAAGCSRRHTAAASCLPVSFLSLAYNQQR